MTGGRETPAASPSSARVTWSPAAIDDEGAECGSVWNVNACDTPDIANVEAPIGAGPAR